MHKVLLPVLPIVTPAVLGSTSSVDHSDKDTNAEAKKAVQPALAAGMRIEDDHSNLRGMPLRRITPYVSHSQFHQQYAPTVYHPSVEPQHTASPYAGFRLVAHPTATRQPLASLMHPAIPHPALSPQPQRKFNPNAKEFVPRATPPPTSTSAFDDGLELDGQRLSRYTLEVETNAQTQTWKSLEEQQIHESSKPGSPWSKEDQDRLRKMLTSLTEAP